MVERLSAKVSVIISCFNQEKYIQKAIKSVLDQDYLPDELIIIDDHSTDQSTSIIESFRNSPVVPVKIVANQTNKGITKNRNLGIELSSGDYISFLDGDDYWAPSKLSEELKIFSSDEDNIDVAFSGFTIVDEKEKSIGNWDISQDDVIDFNRVYQRKFPFGILFRNELIKKKCFIELQFDERLSLYEDFDIRLGMALKFSFKYSGNMGCYYRKTGNSLSDIFCYKHYISLKYLYNKYDRTVKYYTNKVALMVWKEKYLGNLLAGCLIVKFGFFGKIISLPIILWFHPRYFLSTMPWKN